MFFLSTPAEEDGQTENAFFFAVATLNNLKPHGAELTPNIGKSVACQAHFRRHLVHPGNRAVRLRNLVQGLWGGPAGGATRGGERGGKEGADGAKSVAGCSATSLEGCKR